MMVSKEGTGKCMKSKGLNDFGTVPNFSASLYFQPEYKLSNTEKEESKRVNINV